MTSARKIRFGVLGVAAIALRRVIPATQASAFAEISAIASRSLAKAQEAAQKQGIAKAYGSYEELLADPEIDAIYNPLPHHLHVPWSIKALDAGKHVLCEKPLGISVAELRDLQTARDRSGKKVGEGFMVLSHPRWLRVRELVASGRIGELRSMGVSFSYFNRDAGNIRNIPEFAGGALLDIGCYAVVFSRFVFDREPVRVLGVIEKDPVMKTDRLTSAILDFSTGQSVFTCSTQMVHHQSMKILGTAGRIELETPINPPTDRPTRILIDDGRDALGGGITYESIPACDQFTIQADRFARAILDDADVAVPIENSILGAAVIEAIFRSGTSGRWEIPETGAFRAPK